jgi:hypothetical protein
MAGDAFGIAHAIFIITRDFQFLERDPWYQIVAFGELFDFENTSEEFKIFQDTTIPAYILRIKGKCKNATFIQRKISLKK